MKKMLLGIAVLLFAVVLALSSQGMGILTLLIGVAGLALAVNGYFKE